MAIYFASCALFSLCSGPRSGTFRTFYAFAGGRARVFLLCRHFIQSLTHKLCAARTEESGSKWNPARKGTREMPELGRLISTAECEHHRKLFVFVFFRPPDGGPGVGTGRSRLQTQLFPIHSASAIRRDSIFLSAPLFCPRLRQCVAYSPVYSLHNFFLTCLQPTFVNICCSDRLERRSYFNFALANKQKRIAICSPSLWLSANTSPVSGSVARPLRRRSVFVLRSTCARRARAAFDVRRAGSFHTDGGPLAHGARRECVRAPESFRPLADNESRDDNTRRRQRASTNTPARRVPWHSQRCLAAASQCCGKSRRTEFQLCTVSSLLCRASRVAVPSNRGYSYFCSLFFFPQVESYVGFINSLSFCLPPDRTAVLGVMCAIG